jgi:hypothetical protein
MNIYIFENKFSEAPLGVMDAADFFGALKRKSSHPLLARARALSAKIKAAKTNSEVQSIKSELPLVRCVNAIKLENVTEWNGLMGFDLDAKDNPGENPRIFMNRVFAGLHKLNIGLYFASGTPSGGLRFFVRTEGITMETYPKLHEALRVKLEKETGLKLDPSVKNINRGFFIYTESSSAFFDPDSKPYTVEKETIPVKRVNSVVRNATRRVVDGDDALYFERAVNQTEVAGKEFVEGQRHTFITSLAGRLSAYGVSLGYAISMCVQKYAGNGFEQAEITRILEDIYKNNTDNGSFGSLRRSSEREDAVETEVIRVRKYLTEDEGVTRRFIIESFGVGGHVEVVAPTGSGKTTSFKNIVEVAITVYDKIVICAPNKGITKQIAEGMGLAPITEDLKGEERQAAREQGVIVCTYNQLASIADGFPGSMLLILDEAHCLTEDFRASTMNRVLDVVKRSSKSMLFTATPNSLISREVGVVKRVIFEREVIQKKVIHAAVRAKNKLSKAIPTIVASKLRECGGMVSVYINSGSVIRKVIDELIGSGILRPNEVGVYASKGLIKENELQAYDVTECIEKERRVKEEVRLLLCTKAAEYGIDILNENVEHVFLVEQNETTLSADEMHQHTSRFRSIDEIPVTIISANRGSRNKEYSIMSLTEIFEREAQLAEDACNFFNERLKKEFSLELAEKDAVIRQQRNKFITRVSKDEYTRFDADEQAFCVNRLAVIQSATQLYNESLTLEEKMEKLTRSYGFVRVCKKVEEAAVEGGSVKVGDEVVGETLESAPDVGEHRKEALKKILEIKKEYAERFGTSSPPFSAVFLKLAMEEYGYVPPRWVKQAGFLNIEGVRRDVNGELLHEKFNPYDEYNFIKERLGNAYYVAKMRNVLPTFFLFAAIEFNNAFELAIHAAEDKRVSEVVNYFYTHNLIRMLEAEQLGRYDVKFLTQYEGFVKLYDALRAKHMDGEWFRVKDVCQELGIEYTQREGRFVAAVFNTESRSARVDGKIVRFTKITAPTTLNEALEKYNITLSLPENIEETLKNYVGAYAYNIEEAKQQPPRVKPKLMPRPRVTPEQIFNMPNYLHEEIPEAPVEAPF